MKTQELINKLQNLPFVQLEVTNMVECPTEIAIGDQSDIGARIHFTTNANGWLMVDNFSSSSIWTDEECKTIEALLDEYLKTPVKQRASEKKYRLYLGLIPGTRDTEYWLMKPEFPNDTTPFQLARDYKNPRTIWTENEVDKLKRQLPIMADSIENMKAPVIDSDKPLHTRIEIVRGSNNDINLPTGGNK